MKKITLLAVAAFGLTITSCRKERTCDCKTTETEVVSGFEAGTYVDNTSSKVTKEKQRKKPFKYSENCFSESYTYYDSGGNGPTAWTSVTTVDTKCELE